MDFQPKRKVVKRGNVKRVGYFPSDKMGRPIAFESLLEEQLLFFLEYEPTLKEYYEQPLEIKYFSGGRKRSYYPDFAAVYFDKPTEIIEVKPSKKLSDPKLLPKFEAGSCFCIANDYQFKIITEQDIDPIKLKNIKYLFRYHKISVPLSVCRHMQANVSNYELTIDNLSCILEERAGGYGRAMAMIYNQIFHHRLSVDITRPIDVSNTIVTLGVF
jgi:hypothetical protein